MSLNILELKSLSSKTKKLVFILHGYGADANDLFSIANYWQRFLPEVHFCVPNAPNVCQVNASGFEWFDLMQTNNDQIRKETMISLDKLDKCITTKLDELILELKDLILVGFSQGTMMSIQYAIRQKVNIAGVLGYSGKIYDYDLFDKELKSKPRIKLFHGNGDEIVPIEEMYKSNDFLEQKGFVVDYHVYEGLGHSISPDGLSEGLNFIKSL